ncbi:MAG: PAS domain S-box protein, partial [Anaerolineae bacterium]|nr:PAS domain S-box protein [Anaerolineae bacterium]
TEQKHTRQIAAENQTRFRIVAEASEAAIVLMKGGGTLLYANAAAERISGYSVDEMRTMDLAQLFLKEDRAANESKFRRLLIDDTAPIQIEARIISRDKQEKWLYCSATTTYLNAEPTLVVTALDITAKKQAESRLIQSEALKSAILAASLDAFILTDQSGNILEFNPAAEQLFGHSRAEMRGRNMIHLLVPESHPAYYAELVGVFQDNMPDRITNQRYEITGQHRDGTHIPIELTVFPVQTEGNVTFAAYLRDISDQIRARDNERRANAEKERVKVLTEFVRDSSHDFRTPLSTINTSLYLLQRADDDLKRSEHATAITRQTARLEKLIEGMLMMVRLDSDVEFEYQWIDLNGLVRDVSVRIRSLAARKDQQMKLNLATGVPHIHAAGHELGRALVEILENAVIFTPRGGEISLETTVSDDHIQIEIRDTGVGISETDLPYIFNRFYRVDKARSTETGGVGLGLPIAQKIIQQHGGRIEVESILGEGSTFRVILPIQHP